VPEDTRRHDLRECVTELSPSSRRAYLIYAVRHGYRVIYQAINAQMITKRRHHVMRPPRPSSGRSGSVPDCRDQMHVQAARSWGRQRRKRRYDRPLRFWDWESR
jgi:hypothetical protein